MKKILFLLAATVSGTLSNAQKIEQKNVPLAIKESLQKQYPAAKNVKWEKEYNNYEAEFKLKKTAYSILLNASGSIIETEVAIRINSLAASIKKYMAENYPNQKIKEADQITDAKGVITYEVEVNGNDFIFDHSGNFLKKNKD